LILVECLPDKVLVCELIKRRKIVKHGRGKGNIARLLEMHLTGTIAIIDEDPGAPEPRYLAKLKLLENDTKNSITIKEDPTRKNLVIILSPRLEEWLLLALKESNVNPKDIKLPRDPGVLHDLLTHNPQKVRTILKFTTRSKRIQKLRQIISRLPDSAPR